MEHTTDDLELVLTKALRNLLRPLWSGLYVSRALPETRPSYAVTVQAAGGMPRGRFRDQSRFSVNAYAPTHAEANRLAGDARVALMSIRGHNPIVSIDASVYSDTTDPNELPSRYFFAEVLHRRSQP